MRLYYVLLFLLAGLGRASAQLSADFIADPRSGCAPIRILFNDQSKGSPDRWLWDLGNGTLSTARDPSTTYFVPGSYTIKLTVYKGTDSATISKANYISIYAIPNVSFIGNPLKGCSPLPVQFTDMSTTATGTLVDWKWDFGDGYLGATDKPLHIYKTQGLFNVTLTVTNSNGCVNSFTIPDYISVNDSLRAKFGAFAAASCNVPVTATFKDSSTGSNITSWFWDFGDGATSNLQNPVHVYNTAGTYDVKLIVQNSSGCVDTLVKKGAVNAANLKASFNIGSGQFCLGSSAFFPNTSTPLNLIDSSVWIVSDGTRYNTKDLSKIFSTAGNYTIKLIFYRGICSDQVTQTISVVPSAGANFSAFPTIACKPPLSVLFQNASGGSSVVSWDFGNGQTSTLENPTVLYNSFGNYDVKLIVRSVLGCYDTIVKPAAVTITPPAINSVAGLPYDGCFPYTATFTPKVTTNDPVVKWDWNFGDGTTSNLQNPTKTFASVGDYQVKLVITTSAGCVDTFTSIVRGSDKPKSNFKADPLVVCPSTTVHFTDLSTGTINKWKWFFGDGGSSSSQTPDYLYNDTGLMTVKLIVYNRGCSDTFSIDKYIYVSPPIAVLTDSFDCSDQRTHFFHNKSIGATVWKWYFGDGDSSNAWETVHTYKDTGRYTAVLWVADSLCEHRSNAPIMVLNEKARIVANNMGGCNTKTIKFEAQSPQTHPENIAKYEWTFNAEAPVYTDTNYIERIFNDTTTITLKLKIFDLNSCTDSVTQTIPILFTAAKANFGPAVQNVCVGSLVNFTDSSRSIAGNPITKWTWNFGNGNDTVFTKSPFQTRYMQPGIYDVKMMIEDASGCKDTIEREAAVIVHKSTADFITTDTLVCLNSPVHFTDLSVGSNGTTSMLVYKWNLDAGKIDSVPNPVVTYNKSGAYSISLSIKDPYGCVDTMQKPLFITVADAHADFKMSDSFSTCPPLLVNLTNKSTSNIVNIWSFGDGNSSTLYNPSHTYTSPGIFNVKLKVTGNGGCTDSAIHQVKIQGPSGVFTYAPLANCPPMKVDFKSNAINTKYYTWDFSDGTSDVTLDSMATHTYLVPGKYVPRLILEDGLGCKLPVNGPDTIRIFGAKALIQSIKTAYYCDSASISFFDSSITTDVIVRYRWRFGDGAESTIANPKHTYKTPGRYTVTLEVWTANSCYTTDTLDAPILIAASPKIDYTRDSAVCVPATVNFTGYLLNPDSSIVTYQWNFGNGLSSTRLVPVPVLYKTPGAYSVSLLATNNYGCTGLAVKPLAVNDTPRITATPNPYLCLGQSVRLNAAGAVSYSWDPQPTLSCLNCATPLANPVRNTIYRVTGADVNGCISTDTVLIRVKQPGKLSVGLGDTICVGEKVQLVSKGFEILRWSPSTGLSNPNIANPVATPQVTTNYRVIGTDSLRCFTDSGSVPIVVYPIPQLDILQSFVKAELGTIVQLNTKASPDVTKWRWSPVTNLSCSTCPQPLATITQRLKYTADVFNDGGCKAEDIVSVEPTCTGENIFIPNTFSPNGDGQNDIFYPRGRGVTRIKRMTIFNRWGELMYERKDFSLNDPTAGWNGSYRGQVMTADVFVYIMEVLCGNNETFTIKGNVTLLQ